VHMHRHAWSQAEALDVQVVQATSIGMQRRGSQARFGAAEPPVSDRGRASRGGRQAVVLHLAVRVVSGLAAGLRPGGGGAWRLVVCPGGWAVDRGTLALLEFLPPGPSSKASALRPKHPGGLPVAAESPSQWGSGGGMAADTGRCGRARCQGRNLLPGYCLQPVTGTIADMPPPIFGCSIWGFLPQHWLRAA